MKDYKLKLGAIIGFDSKKEKDMIEYINRLAEQRRLGDFISNTIRIVLENPVEVKRLGFDMTRFDVSESREKYYNEISKQINEMSEKIDKIYDMTMKLFMMAQFGKVVGIEQQAENLAGAQLVLQHQVREICSSLGVNADRLYKSNEYVNMEEAGEEVMAYIMSHYSNEVNSIMNAFSMMQSKMMQFVGGMTPQVGVQIQNVNEQQNMMHGYGNNMNSNNDINEVAKLSGKDGVTSKDVIKKDEYKEELKKHDEFKSGPTFDDGSAGVTFSENADLDLLAQFLG